MCHLLMLQVCVIMAAFVMLISHLHLFFVYLQRRKLKKDTFVPSSLKKIEIDGIFGQKVGPWEITA